MRAERDLRPLLGAGVAAIIAAAALAATAWVAGDWLAGHERAFRRAQADLAAAAQRYRNASDDQAVYEQYATRFRRMRERGWIGAEQRLSWIEALQKTNRRLRLPTLRYDIAERRPVPLDSAPFDTSRLQLHRTPMQLTLGALHEGDLLTLLGELAERGKGLAALERCALQRAGGSGQVRLGPGATNVEIGCTLHWYSLEIRPEDAAS